MMRARYNPRVALKYILLSVVVALMVLAPLTHSLHPQHAEATYPVNVVGGPGSAAQIKSSIANNITANGVAGPLGLVTKEYILDELAFVAAKLALQQMTASIIQWINSGFEGSPAFVADLDGYLLDIADQAAGRFLDSSELRLLCTPFQAPVIASLEIYYNDGRGFTGNEVQCRLTDAIENVEDFLAGNFHAGGWQNWFEITTKPQNNPYGAYVIARHEMDQFVQSQVAEEEKLLEFGEGFLSFKDCSEVEGGSGNCTIVTPGQIIEEQLTFNLSTGQRSIIQADELNEVLSALFGQLAEQAITGVGGLLGLSSAGATGAGGGSGSGSGGAGGSYLDSLASGTGTGEDDSIGYVNRSTPAIARAISNEQDLIAYSQRLVNIVDDAETYAASQVCTDPSLPLPSTLSSIRTRAQSDIADAQSVIAQLNGIAARYEAATDPTEREQIYNEFTTLAGGGAIHDEVDTQTMITIGAEVEDAQTRANEFEIDVDEAEDECLANDSSSGSNRQDP